MTESKLRTAILISGGGTTAEAIIKACQQDRLKGILPVAVISSQQDAGGIKKAQALGIPTFVIQRNQFPIPEEFGDKLLQLLKLLKVDFVSQNGWLPLTPENVVQAFSGRIINQHPGPLDPGRKADFGGKGMFGARVNCAVLAYLWSIGANEHITETESTVHFVTPHYDQGDLISVVRMRIPTLTQPVTIAQLSTSPGHLIKTTQEVQSLLLPIEHQNVIAALQRFSDGTVAGFRRPAPLIPEGDVNQLIQAKKLAINLFPEG